MARAQDLEKAGENVIHREVGEPDFETHESFRNAPERQSAPVIRIYSRHGPSRAREAICEHYLADTSQESPEQILVTRAHLRHFFSDARDAGTGDRSFCPIRTMRATRISSYGGGEPFPCVPPKRWVPVPAGGHKRALTPRLGESSPTPPAPDGIVMTDQNLRTSHNQRSVHHFG